MKNPRVYNLYVCTLCRVASAAENKYDFIFIVFLCIAVYNMAKDKLLGSWILAQYYPKEELLMQSLYDLEYAHNFSEP